MFNELKVIKYASVLFVYGWVWYE